MHHLTFAAACLFVSASLCSAQTVFEDYKIHLSNNSAGSSLAISDQYIVIGDSNAGDFGGASGAVSVFEAASGDFLYRLTAPAQVEEEFFGESVAISGSTLLVSAVASSEIQTDGGIVYLYDVSTGSSAGTLSPSDLEPGDNFGARIAVSDGLALIGSPGDDDNGSSAGSAYVFDIATGQEHCKFLPDDGSTLERFGRWGVGIDGSTAVLGVAVDDPSGPVSGSAYVFDAITGQQLHKLSADDGQASEFFGWSAAITGGVIAVGVTNDQRPGGVAGSVYRYDAVSGSELGVYVQPNPGIFTELGRAVAAYDGTFLVGAFREFVDGDRTGAAFTFDAATGQHIQRYGPSDGGSQFGSLVAIGAGGLLSSNTITADGVYVYLSDVPCVADLAPPAGVLNFFDIAEFIGFFTQQDPSADIAAQFGAWNFFDVSAYITPNAGCP